jgi:hypothetical protein
VIEFAVISPDRYLICFLVTLTLSPDEERMRPPGFVELTTKGTSQELPACRVWKIGGYLFSDLVLEDEDSSIYSFML